MDGAPSAAGVYALLREHFEPTCLVMAPSGAAAAQSHTLYATWLASLTDEDRQDDAEEERAAAAVVRAGQGSDGEEEEEEAGAVSSSSSSSSNSSSSSTTTTTTSTGSGQDKKLVVAVTDGLRFWRYQLPYWKLMALRARGAKQQQQQQQPQQPQQLQRAGQKRKRARGRGAGDGTEAEAAPRPAAILPQWAAFTCDMCAALRSPSGLAWDAATAALRIMLPGGRRSSRTSLRLEEMGTSDRRRAVMRLCGPSNPLAKRRRRLLAAARSEAQRLTDANARLSRDLHDARATIAALQATRAAAAAAAAAAATGTTTSARRNATLAAAHGPSDPLSRVHHGRSVRRRTNVAFPRQRHVYKRGQRMEQDTGSGSDSDA
jgi:hypothetical protein